MNRADRKLFNREMKAYMDMDKKWLEKYQALAAELETVKRERDALRYDLLHLACDCIPACSICKHYTIGTEMCPHVKEIGAQDIDDCFEWRGLCKENGGATDE